MTGLALYLVRRRGNHRVDVCIGNDDKSHGQTRNYASNYGTRRPNIRVNTRPRTRHRWIKSNPFNPSPKSTPFRILILSAYRALRSSSNRLSVNKLNSCQLRPPCNTRYLTPEREQILNSKVHLEKQKFGNYETIIFHSPEIIISRIRIEEKGEDKSASRPRNRTSHRRIPIRVLLLNVFTRREVYRLERDDVTRRWLCRAHDAWDKPRNTRQFIVITQPTSACVFTRKTAMTDLRGAHTSVP